MSSYAILKINKDTKECLFLMANAIGTKTFKNDIYNAWSSKDHRVASNLLTKCIYKHNDKNKFEYLIDDLDESGDWQRRYNMKKYIDYGFEGFTFRLAVDYEVKKNCIVLVRVEATSHMQNNVNRQEFFHMLHVLRNKIYMGECSEEIKEYVAKELNYCEKVYCCKKIVTLIVIITVVIASIFIWR